ncbi:alpha/beta fold hydrolase [Pontibacter ramchanderi]|uniref:Pimeloyl-ACP methyl ester carboxylesterase n=1 Tax=Pontibacter ramchanderi TaxID=1179743 RepID=A0A2N3V3H4_9BACT|nr:alpha/beta hydrolase [Pontibacter ramchanderi]PKV76184.1 pimeloyl-ACP methyl ester carboxylesterase [Pontibacter ramchanderi]
MKKQLYLLTFLFILCFPAVSQSQRTYNATLSDYAYRYPVNYLEVEQEGQKFKMAYMDVSPPAPFKNPQTVLLLHGKNFLGAYWQQTMHFLAGQGFRVVVPDQLGFGKSDKAEVQYSFHQLAQHTRHLLEHLKISEAVVVGHSMGGMLATRFALMYPEATTKLVLENPIGLEDYRRIVPYRNLDELYQEELKRTETGIRDYHKTYYTSWKPAYDEWVRIPAAQLRSPDYPLVARVAAHTYAMIYEQPVVYEFSQLTMPVLLAIGLEDRTVVGKAYIKSEEERKKYGQYPQLGQQTAGAIPNARLLELKGVGHIPHIEAPEQFHKALLEFLKQ